MRTFLSAICVALSIYYVFAAPRHRPTSAPTHTTSDTRKLVEQMIEELLRLESTVSKDLGLIPTLYRNEKNVTIEKVSCRAQYSISHITSNITDELEHLLEKFIAHRSVTCPTLTPEDDEVDRVDIRNVITYLLDKFREHNVDSLIVSVSKGH